MKIDYNKVKEEALREIEEEKVKEAKVKIKEQLKRVDNAHQIWKNEQRKLDDLYLQIEQGIQ